MRDGAAVAPAAAASHVAVGLVLFQVLMVSALAMSSACGAHPRGGCFWALGVTPPAGSSSYFRVSGKAELPGRGCPCQWALLRAGLAHRAAQGAPDCSWPPPPAFLLSPFCAGPFDLGTRPLYVAPGLARPPRPTQGWGFPFHLARGARGSERESRRDLVVSQNLGDSAFSGHCGLAALIF